MSKPHPNHAAKSTTHWYPFMSRKVREAVACSMSLVRMCSFYTWRGDKVNRSLECDQDHSRNDDLGTVPKCCRVDRRSAYPSPIQKPMTRADGQSSIGVAKLHCQASENPSLHHRKEGWPRD